MDMIEAGDGAWYWQWQRSLIGNKFAWEKASECIYRNRGGRTWYPAIIARRNGIQRLWVWLNDTIVLKAVMQITVALCWGEHGFIINKRLILIITVNAWFYAWFTF